MKWIILFFVFQSSLVYSGWLYSEKIYSLQQFSYGFEKDGMIYFLSSMHHYREPKWLAKFPDGGQVKTVSMELSLFEYSKKHKKINKLAILKRKKEIGTNIKSAKFITKEQNLLITYRCNNEIKNQNLNQCIYRFDLKRKMGKFEDNDDIKKKLLEKDFKNYWKKKKKALIPISILKKEYLNHIKTYDWHFDN